MYCDHCGKTRGSKAGVSAAANARTAGPRAVRRFHSRARGVPVDHIGLSVLTMNSREMERMKKAAIFNNRPERVDYVYAHGRLERLKTLVELYPEIITLENFEQHVDALSDLEVIFSTWGMTPLSKEQIARLPSLKAVFYGAGSVRKFATPFIESGVTVVSSWCANAIPVAEFTTAQVLLSCKGYWRNTRLYRSPKLRHPKQNVGAGVFGERVGLIGCGMIARKVIELLSSYTLEVVIYDPYVSAEEAASLGVTKVSLEDLFATSYVVSCHLPNIDATRGMLGGALFASMRADATFINTGRGASVVESELIEVLEARDDLTALLDVTFPEPPEEESKFYTLPNVQLSAHIAGSLNDEVVRMADFAMEEFEAWRDGRPLRYKVTLDMLDTMA